MNLEAALASLAEPAPPALIEGLAGTLDLGDQFVLVSLPTASLPVLVAFGSGGVSMLDLARGDASAATEDTFRADFAARYPGRPLRRAETLPARLVTALSGSITTKSVQFDLSSCSPFQQAVLTKTAEIPKGEVRSYGWVAAEIGHAAAVRAVGTALGRNPIPFLIPCHRVVRTDGHIGNYALGTSIKQRLLTDEGVDLDELAGLATAGIRYVGSATTSVFCLPTCHAARRIQARNRVTFRSGGDAARSGYRPCKLCRPAGPSPAPSTPVGTSSTT